MLIDDGLIVQSAIHVLSTKLVNLRNHLGSYHLTMITLLIHISLEIYTLINTLIIGIYFYESLLRLKMII